MPAVNHQLDEVQQDSCSDPSNNRPTATNGALPMLNLTQTSRKRLGLVHENRKGKASRQRKEQDRQNIQHSDSEDSAIDTIRCEKCGEQDYSAANPILLCDGEECGKGWHLDCIPTQGGKRAAARAAIRRAEDWFCDDSCRHWEFESNPLKELGCAAMVRKSTPSSGRGTHSNHGSQPATLTRSTCQHMRRCMPALVVAVAKFLAWLGCSRLARDYQPCPVLD